MTNQPPPTVPQQITAALLGSKWAKVFAIIFALFGVAEAGIALYTSFHQARKIRAEADAVANPPGPWPSVFKEPTAKTKPVDDIFTGIKALEARDKADRERLAATCSGTQDEKFVCAVEKEIVALPDIATKSDREPNWTLAFKYGDLARYALLAKQYDKALTAVDRSLAIWPARGTTIEICRAHALMLKDRTDEARTLYATFKGATQLYSNIADDFAEFERRGITSPLIAEVKATLGLPPPTNDPLRGIRSKI